MAFAALLGIAFGAWSSVFCLALTEPGQVFWFVGSFFLWLDRKLSPYITPNPVYLGVKKVLYLCPKCQAGQLSFWLYFVWCYKYNPWDHFVCVSLAVFVGFIVENFYQWQQRA
jgi:hypothetical protein